MLLKRIFSCLFTICTFTYTQAQFSEGFTNGDLSTAPTWLGDTTFFHVNTEEKLQLNAPPESGKKFIYTSSHSIENAQWEIEVGLGFNPSSSNYTDIYLALDTCHYSTASGYFVRIGNTQDEISLYRQTGSLNVKTKIIDGRDKIIDTTSVAIKVKVTRDETGNWKLFTDVGILGNYVLEGEVFDNLHLGSSYFGILCTYTSTRSDKFFFDNIEVVGRPKRDIFPPFVDKLDVVDDYQLELVFSEKISLNAQNPETHFLENCTMAQPSKVEVHNDSIVRLTFEHPFPENSACEILLNSIADKAQNILEDTSISYRYTPPRQPAFNELLITEIMADPSPNLELPEYEYLEIYNPLKEKLEVKELVLKIGDGSITIDFEIEPNEYLILCPNAAAEQFKEYGKVMGISKWKALRNNGDTILLYNRYGEQIFSLAYQKNWYDDFKKAEGGYSLEMIDPKNPCGEQLNWTASENLSGGTPGKANSIATSNPDLTAPEIVNAFPVKANEIVIDFDEKLLKSSFTQASISITPSLAVFESQISEPLRKSISVVFRDNFEKKTVYTLLTEGIKDCTGNILKSNSFEFVLSEKADSLDIVFNEVLFNPVPTGVDFIELINRSGKYIDLRNWKFLREKDGNIDEIKLITSNHLVLKPGEIIVFTEASNVLIGQFPHSSEALIFETDIPAMNDDEGTLILTDENDFIIDQLYYNENFHHPMIENKEGVALERISYFNGSTDQEIWQSSASTVGFATPGLKNSQFLNVSGNQAFSIEPKTFAPDNDGYRDFTSINFELSQNYLASLFIFDISGRVVKQILNNQNLPTQGSVLWEGDDEFGNKVNIGNYIVYLELTGPNGERKVYKDRVAVSAKF